jgi:hypothetical protein
MPAIAVEWLLVFNVVSGWRLLAYGGGLFILCYFIAALLLLLKAVATWHGCHLK